MMSCSAKNLFVIITEAYMNADLAIESVKQIGAIVGCLEKTEFIQLTVTITNTVTQLLVFVHQLCLLE
jgi:hypothetical protein